MEQPHRLLRLPGLPVRRLQQAALLGATIGATTIGGFDLIDLNDPEHAILNGVPNVHGGNAAEILADPVSGGTRLTMYNTGSANALTEYTTVISNS